MSNWRERIGYLPAPLMAVLEATGDEDLVWRVAGRAGGRQMRVPRRLTPKTQLVQALGPDDAERAWAVWRGQGVLQVSVPMLSTARSMDRARRLLSLIDGGCTVHEAARRVGMTERGAYKAMARLRAQGAVSSPQLDLFPSS
jgi:hypothetical protein